MSAKKNAKTVCCPHCGGEIASDAVSCRHCGSDSRTGWSGQTYLDGIDLPDDESYDEMVEREFGGGSAPRRRITVSWKAVVGFILLALFAVMVVRGLF